MKTIARRKKATTLRPIYNREIILPWDRDDILFVIDSKKVRELAEISDDEFIVHHKNFKEPCIAYKIDWEII